jgi:ankyrin repeat protein
MVKHGADVNAQVNGADKYSGRVSYAWRDPNFTQSNEGMTALHVAARSQNLTLVKYLLDHGARTDIVDASGRTPLDVLNGVPALPPHVNADAEGLIRGRSSLRWRRTLPLQEVGGAEAPLPTPRSCWKSARCCRTLRQSLSSFGKRKAPRKAGPFF